MPKDLANQRLVLALGESTTFGWAVADDESYPHHLETILNSDSEADNFVVVNAGVPSYSSQQVFLYAEQLLTRFHPHVVLVSILWNDLFYSSLEDWTPQSLVPRYPSELQKTMYQYSRVYRWFAGKPAKRQLVDYYSKDALAEYRKNIANIAGLCKSKGVPVVFVEPPFSEHWIEAAGVTTWANRFSREFIPKLADIFLETQIQETESQQVPFVRHQQAFRNVRRQRIFSIFCTPTARAIRSLLKALRNSCVTTICWLRQNDHLTQARPRRLSISSVGAPEFPSLSLPQLRELRSLRRAWLWAQPWAGC